MAIATAGPNDDQSKPKPKPKPKHKKRTDDDNYGTPAPTGWGDSVQELLGEDSAPSSSNVMMSVESTGLVALLGGIAVFAVVAIVTVLRQPHVEHEPLPDSSERADNVQFQL